MSVDADADVGFLGHGEVVGIENKGKGSRGWWPLPLVKCKQGILESSRFGNPGNGGYHIQEREVTADVAWFHPRMNQDILTPYRKPAEAKPETGDMSAP